MKNFPEKIQEFISEHHVLTLATCNNSVPWTANCFYVFDPETLTFIFSTDLETRHGIEALANNAVAINIVLETKTVGKIQGLQCTATIQVSTGDYKKTAQKKYLAAFPYAILKKTTLWECKLTYAKLTDNRLGFGTKLIWEA